MTTTANLGLNLPEGSDYADIAALNANFQKLDSVVSAAKSAEEYDPAATYAVGAYGTKDGKLYRCTTAITAAEAWNAAHWTETSVGAEIAAAYAALTAHTGNTTAHLTASERTAWNGKANTVTLTCTVPVSWTASGDYFWQNVSVPGMMAADNPTPGVLFGSDNAANKLYDEAFSKVLHITTYDNLAQIWCTEAPTVAFPLQFKVVR